MKRACLAILSLALAGCATSPEITFWNMAQEVISEGARLHNINLKGRDHDAVERLPEWETAAEQALTEKDMAEFWQNSS
ncbi:MAG TPA: hypothetical protein VGK27_08625 [Candidatus Deferrimicrobiaceae bacterium]|jgi:uncharacterized protein YcfL